LDKSSRIDPGGLQADTGVPEGRDVRTNQSTAASGCLHRGEYCGGLRAKIRWRDEKISTNCAWSASELEYHFLLARDLQILDGDEFKDLEARVLEVQRMLASLVQRLQGCVLAKS
jgi:hypothetical protein